MLLTPNCQNYIFITAHISFYFYRSPHFFLHHLHSYTKILALIYLTPTANSHAPTLISCIPTPILLIPTLIPHTPTPVLRISTMISGILTLIPFISIILILIPRISIIPAIPFPDSHFQFLHLAKLTNPQRIFIFDTNHLDRKV